MYWYKYSINSNVNKDVEGEIIVFCVFTNTVFLSPFQEEHSIFCKWWENVNVESARKKCK